MHYTVEEWFLKNAYIAAENMRACLACPHALQNVMQRYHLEQYVASATFPSFGTPTAESHVETLKNYYLPDFILALVAKQCGSELSQKGKITKKLQSMNQKALDLLHEVFVECKDEPKYVDYRFFAYVSSMYYKSEVLINEQIAGATKNHKVPVAIKKDGVYIAVAFNKSTGSAVTKKEIVRFYEVVDDIRKGPLGTQLGFATFCSSVGFKGEALVELERLDGLRKNAENVTDFKTVNYENNIYSVINFRSCS